VHMAYSESGSRPEPRAHDLAHDLALDTLTLKHALLVKHTIAATCSRLA
jgi:hypothetical protein